MELHIMKGHSEVLTVFCIVGLFAAAVVPASVSASEQEQEQEQAVDIVEDTGDTISLSNGTVIEHHPCPGQYVVIWPSSPGDKGVCVPYPEGCPDPDRVPKCPGYGDIKPIEEPPAADVVQEPTDEEPPPDKQEQSESDDSPPPPPPREELAE
jgi:hypothetical protein